MTLLPNHTAQLTEPNGRATPTFYRFLTELASNTGDTEIAALAERVLALEGADNDTTILGTGGIEAYRVDGAWHLRLKGGASNLGPGMIYATDARGPRWLSIASVFQPGADFVVNDSGYLLKGVIDDSLDLPAAGNTLNDAYRVEGLIWYWDGTQWLRDPDASGVLTITLADVPDAGGGILQKTAFDAKGRKTGSSAATTDDLTEGSTNLYFTDERAQDAVGAAIAAGTGDGVTLSYDDAGNAISATNTDKGSVAVSAHEGEADPHPQYATTAEAQAIADAKIASTIVAGDTTHAPSGDAVFDALAGKADDAKLTAIAGLSANQALANGTNVKVNLDTESVDTNNCFDTATGRFTPTQAGNYFVIATVAFIHSSGAIVAGERLISYIIKNGATYSAIASGCNLAATTIVQVTALVPMNGTTDYIEMHARRDTTPTYAIASANTLFSAIRLST